MVDNKIIKCEFLTNKDEFGKKYKDLLFCTIC